MKGTDTPLHNACIKANKLMPGVLWRLFVLDSTAWIK